MKAKILDAQGMELNKEPEVTWDEYKELADRMEILLKLIHAMVYAACYHKDRDKYESTNLAFMEAMRLLGHEKILHITIDRSARVQATAITEVEDEDAHVQP